MTQTVDPAATGIILSPDPVIADGVGIFDVIVTVNDVEGPADPIADLVVRLALSGSDYTIVANDLTTDVDGVVHFEVKGTTATAHTATLTVDPEGDPIVLDQHPTVEFGAESSLVSVVTGGISSGVPLAPPMNGPLLPDTIWIVHGPGGEPFGIHTVDMPANVCMVARDKYTLNRTDGVLQDPPTYTYVTTYHV